MKQPDDILMRSIPTGTFKGIEIRSDVFYCTNEIVNVVMIGNPEGKWVLIDTGLPGFANQISNIAAQRFPYQSQPSAVVLTHGHFDHAGNVAEFTGLSRTPVYAHPAEFSYLGNQCSYAGEKEILARLPLSSPYYRGDITSSLVPLPNTGTIPELPGWKWIHTPGHSPGHISLFRESDRTLIAGDAFVTVRMDSFYKAIFQQAEINGPPTYFTTNWDAAFESVKKLAALNPDLVITGHGPAMQGEELSIGLKELVEDFNEIAVPKYGL